MNLAEIEEALNVLKQGGIVIYPTDTAFGIGCRIDSPKSIERLFKIRKRPQTQAVPVLVADIDMAKEYLEPISTAVSQLMNTYWPGALTIIYRCQVGKVPLLARGGGTTLGVRMPDHKGLLQIIRHVGVPILGPSANFHGEETPFTNSNLNPRLLQHVDYVVSGRCKSKQASTVVDCSNKKWQVVREGSVQIDLHV